MKLVFEEGYTEEQSKLVISQIDFELKKKRELLNHPFRRNKKIIAYVTARIQDLENWKLHYQENTL